MTVSRERLARWFDQTLEVERFSDYCPNGLQVQGREQIAHLVSGVTASATLIREAVSAGADALVVHHGYFWRGEDPRLIGVKGARIAALMRADLNLFAFHLPLDAHPVLGNNACLAQRLGLPVHGRGGDRELIFWADLEAPASAQGLASQLEQRLGRAPMLVGAAGPIVRVAWCTGAAQDAIEQAAALGAQAFISGEISERTTHLARELGLAYLAAGHHATERDGVQALGEAAAAEFGLRHTFIDDPNPV
ncbi:MAG: Nif3-like dinuclear metal center hexameric protein [Burkholderiaceae bacterium]